MASVGGPSAECNEVNTAAAVAASRSEYERARKSTKERAGERSFRRIQLTAEGLQQKKGAHQEKRCANLFLFCAEGLS